MSQHGSSSQDPATFAYTEADAIRILGTEHGSNSFLTVPTGDNLARELEKEKRRLTGLELHTITLKEYYKTKRIPRGLRVNLRPTIFIDNTEFVKRYEQIANKCSFDILLLNIEYLQATIPETQQRISQIEKQLKDTFRGEELKTLLTRTEEAVDKHRRLVEERKRHKFRRDTEDYRTGNVYHWGDTDASTGYQRNIPRDPARFTRRQYTPPRKQLTWRTPAGQTAESASDSSASDFLDFSPPDQSPGHGGGKTSAGTSGKYPNRYRGPYTADKRRQQPDRGAKKYQQSQQKR